MKKREILLFAISADVFKKYVAEDDCLKNIQQNLQNNREAWNTFKNISVSSSINTLSLARTYKVRLKSMPNDSRYKNLRDDYNAIVNYCNNNTQSNISMIIFNCLLHSYILFLEIQELEPKLVFLFRRGHIPDYALEK